MYVFSTNGGTYQDSGYVFTHPDGRPYYPSYPSHELKKVLAKHPELPNIRFHDLRHSYATNLYRAGIDLKTAQYLLGHSSIQVTANIYTHLDRDEAAGSITQLEQYLSGGSQSTDDFAKVVKK